MSQEQIQETLTFMKKTWAVFALALLYAAIENEYHFPGQREDPLGEGERLLWIAQRVLFFGLMALGFLIDLVRMREDRSKAYHYLFLSLVVGGLSGPLGTVQHKILAGLLGGP
ncbi:MAG: hypothetical protein JSU88_04785 [Nitrospinaceae bacterium]|jgi:FtsH-binding integral membrane protein|nr:MAG: hypothetical protein JSU88_04785 [Nitrospinaceae bacterium]